jgi:hypothetical protein
MHKNNTADFRNCGMAPDPLAIDSGGAEDFVVFQEAQRMFGYPFFFRGGKHGRL